MNARREAASRILLACIDEGDHLVVEAAGNWTDATFRQIIDFARDGATARGITRILLDTRDLSQPDVAFTRYLAGLYIAQVMRPRFRVAAIGRPENVTHHGETVGIHFSTSRHQI